MNEPIEIKTGYMVNEAIKASRIEIVSVEQDLQSNTSKVTWRIRGEGHE